MATFVKRGDSWQAKVRRKGYEPISRTFDTKALAERWARDVEAEMDRGSYVDRTEAERTSLKEALERYEREVTPKKKGASQERHRIAKWLRKPAVGCTVYCRLKLDETARPGGFGNRNAPGRAAGADLGKCRP